MIYEGQFRSDNYEGAGVLFNEEPDSELNSDFEMDNFEDLDEGWFKYDGLFKSGMRHGQGTLHLVNGDQFTGTFNNDQIQGEGTYKKASGAEVAGEWKKNKLCFKYKISK